ncbi:MAG TPA: threonine--tRNA ligase [Candidatus Diapherotrites archaeon]|nr:threonine--tRNA ligase [Candidatus Diapherotrites archaeon]
MKIEVKFPDGSKREIEAGKKAKDIILENIGEGLARIAIAVKANGKLIDLETPITTTTDFLVITYKDKEGKEIFWHSSSHIMALAIKRLFPDVKFAIGPAIDEGFYYDIDINRAFTEEELQKIEEEVNKIIKEDMPFERFEVDFGKALEIFKDNPYKLELINEIKDKGEKISYYKIGEFSDLCRGPHISSSGKIKAFKVLKASGAYWRGNSKNKQLQRIYGISYNSSTELKEYLTRLEEAAKRDHRKIGKELDLYSFQEEAPGMPFFHAKGSIIWNKLVEFLTEKLYKRNYEINKTPMILNQSLWLRSGHWDHYKDNMYFTKIDDQDYALKPMNCPGNLLIYKSHQYSYRDLPIRAGEFGLVHRHELSGVLSGLFRARCFTQDDAHIFCTREQMKDEIIDLINLLDEVYETFGFTYRMELSTKPENAMGDPALWDLAENTLKEVLDSTGKEYNINPGDGAFYGPKIDFHLKDAIGRNWQCGTIQLDFQMPEKFNLTYEGPNNEKLRPVMLHRAIYGSVERFMGILVEEYEGKFPLWLSPVQVIVLPIAERHNDYARVVSKVLTDIGLRVEIDDNAQTMNKKIRNAELSKINYILVVGDSEENNQTVNVRTRDNEILGEIKVSELIKALNEEIIEKRRSRKK